MKVLECRSGRHADCPFADEERFFEEDDDDEEQAQGPFPEHDSNGAMSFMPRGGVGLVDYDDDDDDDLSKGGAPRISLQFLSHES